MGSGADKKTRQLGSCLSLHAYLGWLCQCFSISFSLTHSLFGDTIFWPRATMELSPLENHAEYCIQHMSDSVSFKFHCFLGLHVVDFMHLPCHKMGCNMIDNTTIFLGAIGLCQY